MQRSSTSALSSAFVAVGLMLVYVWSSLSDHTFSLRESLPLFLGINPRSFFLLGIGGLCIAFVASSRLSRARSVPLDVLLPVVGAVGTACIAIAPHQTLFSAAALCAIGLIALGVSYCWFIVRFGLLFFRDQSIARIVYCIAAALIMEPLVRVGLESSLGQSALSAIAVGLPLVAAGLLYGAQALEQREGTSASRCGDEGPQPSLRQILSFGKRSAGENMATRESRGRLVLLFATALLLATVRSLSPVGTWDAPFDPVPMTSSPLLVIIYATCVAVFARFAVADTQGKSVLKRFQPAFLLVVLTMLTSIVLLYTQGPQSAILYTSMCLNDSFAHILFWATAVCVAKSVPLPAARTVGLGLAVYAVGSIVWLLLIGESEMLETVASVAAITILYVLTLVAVKTGEEAAAAPVSPGTAVDSDTPEGTDDAATEGAANAADNIGESIEGRCREIAREHKLSPRETDVMVLLAQGRTRLYIQEELFIAENTVKTHIAHIYKKLGVNNRQDLLDLVFGKGE